MQLLKEIFREVVRGIILAGWRLLRCNPASHGGIDYPCDQKIFRR